MNESFGSAHRRIKTNMAVTPYYDSLTKVTKGNLYVNTFGGGTANTEFEFLTGMTIGNYPYPVMPYNNFVKRNKYSIARYFNNLGYKTVAMHPYTATNYHRDKVYKRFGFDELMFFEDFRNKQYVRNFVSDRSMYEEVIRKFRNTRASGQKLFLFGITMQNHSGYKDFDGAEILSHMTNYKDREAVDSYLSLMKISDTAIELLIDYFDRVEDHVIILFFGDHNASFGTEINKIVYDQGLNYECSNAYMTPFFIYDNKNRKDEYIDAISANFLSIELLKRANLPFDILHDMLNDLYKKYSVYNYHKALKRDDDKLCDIPNDKFMKLEKEYLK
jgi:phosphoglycerol transferase MdoB-like AlkP superfamily enzyme